MKVTRNVDSFASYVAEHYGWNVDTKNEFIRFLTEKGRVLEHQALFESQEEQTVLINEFREKISES